MQARPDIVLSSHALQLLESDSVPPRPTGICNPFSWMCLEYLERVPLADKVALNGPFSV